MPLSRDLRNDYLAFYDQFYKSFNEAIQFGVVLQVTSVRGTVAVLLQYTRNVSTRYDKYVKDPLLHSCILFQLAHRLQLILKSANKGNEKKNILPICSNCLKLQKYNNMIAKFYKFSHKKKRHLKNFCESNGYTKFFPKKTMDVRWVQSHAESNEGFFDNFMPLVLHMRRIQNDRYFRRDAKTKTLAPQYEKYLTHQNMIATLAFVLDIQMVYKGLSEDFQIKGNQHIMDKIHFSKSF